MSKKTTIHVENVGCIRDFAFDVEPGVTVLRSRNGRGKTCLINAAARAHGAEVSLEPRDGTDEGRVRMSVDGDEVLTLQVRKNVRSQGAAEVRLADVGPLSDLIDPMIKDPAARHARRNAALLKLVRVPVSEENLAVLAGDNQVAAMALRRCREEFVDDILTAQTVVTKVAHSLARETEEGRDHALGRANAHELHADEALRKLGGKDRLLETFTPEEAEQQERDLSRQFETARVTARQRLELEARQAEVRASIGDRPDPSQYDVDIEIRRNAIAAADQRLEELNENLREVERRIAQQREVMAGVRADLKAVEESKQREAERLAAWERQAAVLEQPVTGPAPDEVESLRLKVEAAQDRTVRARNSADYFRNRTAESEARQEAKELNDRSEILRALATTARERLAHLLAGTPAAGFTIHDGRLHVRDEATGELLDFETRQSDGQRIRRALEAWAAASGSAFAPLSGRLWTALDPESRQQTAAIAASLGLTVVTEEPTESEEIEVAHLGAVAAAPTAEAIAS